MSVSVKSLGVKLPFTYIETFSMGCIVRDEFECYNELVSKHLEQKYNKSLEDIYDEVYVLLEEEYGL